jgi:hypothetical protein
MDSLELFESDIMISWDFSNHDYPCISVSRLRSDNGKVICDVMGISHKNCGVISLQQVLHKSEGTE